ncbi:MAG: transposase [Ferruginibacter sp.]|nr:transposase [Cytophagales bacterium]
MAPLSGQVFAMFLPTLNRACFQLFAQQMNPILDRPSLLVADRATAHQAKLLTHTQLTLAHLPTACPELNPVERFFQELRRQMKSPVFLTLQAAQDSVERVLKAYFEQPERVRQLTAYPCIVHASQSI